jgi:biotin synthesis protein BioG
MKTFLRNNGSDELYLVFCGWGMDEKSFAPLKSNKDILFVFDYSDLDFSYDFSMYKKVYLISFSAGVLCAAILKDKLPKLEHSVAVNGTFKLFDSALGTAPTSLSMMENVNKNNFIELRRRLIYGKKHLALFTKNECARTIESSLTELKSLKKISKDNKNIDFNYDKVIIGQNDEIIPYSNQMNSWKNHKNKRIIAGGHFLFYNFDSFEQIIDL